MAADNNWPGDGPFGPGGGRDGGDPGNPDTPGTAPQGQGSCGPGTVPESIGADGNWRTAAPGECISQEEFNRRVNLNVQNNPGNPRPGGGGGGGMGESGPTAPVGPARFPFEAVPQFEWSEAFTAPTLEQAKNEPGYQFASEEGRKALEASAAARGVLRTGGTLKDILGWGNKFAEQNYGGVFDRYARGYDARYQAAKDKYAPNLLGWQTRTAFGTKAASDAWNRAWDDYFRSTLSASDIFNAGRA